MRRAREPDPRGRGGDPVGLDPAPLCWGRHFLMCPPTHFDVTYEINPYMDRTRPPDHDRAEAQFAGLVDALRQAGAVVSLLDPVPGLPDLVFTANAGLVDVGGGRRWFVPGRFRHRQRRGETSVDVAWFANHGWSVVPVPGCQPFEGAGDALPFGAGGDRPVLVAGYRTRSSVAAHLALSSLLGVPVRSVELVDERYYHVDLVFCPIDDRRALVAPQGLDRYGRAVVADVVPEPIWLEDDEAAAFCANSVVVGTTIVMPWCSRRLERQMHRIGLQVVVAPVDEFQKAGGGCRCLTLALDVPIGSPAAMTVPAAG